MRPCLCLEGKTPWTLVCVCLHDSLEEPSLWEEVGSSLSKSHLGALGMENHFKKQEGKGQNLFPGTWLCPAFSLHRLIQKETIYSIYITRKRCVCPLSRCPREGGELSETERNCLSFASHLTPCRVNTEDVLEMCLETFVSSGMLYTWY